MTPAASYSEMKESGIPWVGKIPSGWNVEKAKHCVSITNGSDPKSKGNIPVYGSGAGSFKMCGEYKDGPAVLIGRKGATLNIPHYIVGRYWNVDTAFDVKAKKRFILKYYYYMACCFDYKYYISQTTLPSMTQTNYNNMKIPVPSVYEQQSIAAYLDSVCAVIDSAVAEAKASIEDYKLLRQSIIAQAVTKGLDQNVEMKASGIGWIKKIPKYWRKISLKNLCSMKAGKNLSAEQISNKGTYPVYGGNGQRGYFSNFNYEGDFLLVGRQGALCGNVHHAVGRFWATEHAIVTQSTPLVVLSFLYYLLIGMDLNQYASNAAAQPGLSVNTILHIKTVCPPINEQKAISEYLNKYCQQIDELIEVKQNLMIDLEAYKKSLIFEVVTGKRKVV